MSIVIRPAQSSADDFELTEQIDVQADSILIEFLGAESWFPSTPAEERAAAPGFTLLAREEVSDVAVGFAQVLEIDGLAHLEQLSVAPRYGRRGYGRRLVEAALAEARGRGHSRITLRTFVDVPWNAPFYRSCGFVDSEPDSDFHRQLLKTEQNLGLERYGARVQMTREL